MSTSPSAILALEDGSIWPGILAGHPGTTTGEVVFNTAMSGYQEVLSDPSYAKQMVCFTTAHIGNVGMNDADMESSQLQVSGLIAQSICQNPSNYRAQHSLPDALNAAKITGIEQVDTRALTHHLRDHGSLKGCISSQLNAQQAIAKAKAMPSLVGQDLTAAVSTPVPYPWQQPSWPQDKPPTSTHTVVVIDYGVKRNILRCLVDQGLAVQVVPHQATLEQILAYKPNGVVLSNGPGDPDADPLALQVITQLINLKIPLLGICLGHQRLALACGGKTYKMHHGHHGINHPTVCLANHAVAISSQNHNFSVDEASLPPTLEVTYRSLFDQTIAGLAHKQAPAISWQGHPEAAPGLGIYAQYLPPSKPY